MKILIVDDEALVRNGLKNSILWEELGISQVLLAEEGQQALRVAQQEQPEIVLTDVRMPRMDGIELATRLHRQLPNSHLIFMSGYSDKAYLKAAIQLKAVSYVEKPIDPAEIEAAVTEAVRLQKELTSNLDAQSIRSRMEKSQLAAAMTRLDPQNEASIRKAWSALDLPAGNRLWFATVLLQLYGAAEHSIMPGMTELLSRLQELAQKKRISFLYSIQNDNRVLLQLYRETELTRELIAWFTLQLSKSVSARYQYFIAAGMPVHGLSQISGSYASAMEALNGSFYDEINAILLWDDSSAAMPPIDFDSCITAFRNAVTAGDCTSAREVEQALYQNIQKQRHLPNDVIKNAYYQFISILELVAAKGCVPFSAAQEEHSPWQIVSSTRTVHELHDYLTGLLEEYVRLSRNRSEENELVFLMKDFIRRNYQRDMLSVREIAEAACLSTAYACTLFKNETGTTINQFISGYRMERAKQLLADPRNKITEIASQLGYSDSNYFGKSFKKLVGLSPTEYREKVSKWGP